MRKIWMVILIGSAATSVGLTAQGGMSLRLAAAKGKNVPVFMSTAPDAAPIGVTSLTGDIALASASDKSGKKFVVYMTAEKCPQEPRIIILPKGTPEAQSCQSDECGCGIALGDFTYGLNATIGSSGMWGNPWTWTSIAAGVAAPVVVTQSGGKPTVNQPPIVTTTTSTNPNPPATTPPSTNPPVPPAFPTLSRIVIAYTAAQLTDTGGTFIQPSFPGTGFLTLDSSGYVLEATDPTGQTVILRGRWTANGAQSATLGASDPFSWTSSTSQWNFQSNTSGGQILADGSGSLTQIFTYVGMNPGGRTPAPVPGSTNQRLLTIRRQ